MRSNMVAPLSAFNGMREGLSQRKRAMSLAYFAAPAALKKGVWKVDIPADGGKNSAHDRHSRCFDLRSPGVRCLQGAKICRIDRSLADFVSEASRLGGGDRTRTRHAGVRERTRGRPDYRGGSSTSRAALAIALHATEPAVVEKAS